MTSRGATDLKPLLAFLRDQNWPQRHDLACPSTGKCGTGTRPCRLVWRARFRPVQASSRRLMVVSLVLLAVMLVGTVVAVTQGWPAQFGGGGNPDDVAGEAVTRGTALSPPLAPVVVFVIALLLALRRGTVAVVGAVLLILVSLVFIVGGLGEAFAAPTADVPRAALVMSGLLAVALGATVIGTAIARLRDQR